MSTLITLALATGAIALMLLAIRLLEHSPAGQGDE